MSVRPVWPICLLLGCLLSVITGCNGEEQFQTVSGTISFRDKNLDHGMVSFFGPTGRPISGNINSDGSYEVQLPPGDYSIAINSPPKLPEGFQEGDPTPKPSPDALPAKYSRRRSSGLSVNVQLQPEPQTLDLPLN